MATLVDYGPGLKATPIFESLKVGRPLGRVVAQAGLRQLKVGETEKAIHLTYFFNGKTEEPFPGEERVFIKSEQAEGFAFNPRMKAAEVAQAAMDRLAGRAFDLVVVNLANVDVVNHVEDEAAVIAAVEAVDGQVGRLVAAAQAAGYWTVITADHGSAERWRYEDGTPDTGHTGSPVPCLIVGPEKVQVGRGVDQTQVAPTILHLLGLDKPGEMTGVSLIQGRPRPGRVLLLIADGWGVREEAYGNLILAARTPTMDRLMAEWPWVALAAAGPAVGLPPGTVGNSEVGHLHLAAGRHVDSDRVRIDKALAAGSFYAHPVLGDLARRARR
jgi:2,3-bisphosphoglycerate-independent phosphoglycerate mutase